MEIVGYIIKFILYGGWILLFLFILLISNIKSAFKERKKVPNLEKELNEKTLELKNANSKINSLENSISILNEELAKEKSNYEMAFNYGKIPLNFQSFLYYFPFLIKIFPELEEYVTESFDFELKENNIESLQSFFEDLINEQVKKEIEKRTKLELADFIKKTRLEYISYIENASPFELVNKELKAEKSSFHINYDEIKVRSAIIKNSAKKIDSNLELLPYMSKVMADILTADLKIYAKSLDWGDSIQRANKVQSINSLKKETAERIEKLKWAEYQLDYLLNMYPTLQDVIEADYSDLKFSLNDITDYDPVRNWISSNEWRTLSVTEKNQLALDRYIESRRKSKWQIGRDYELYIGYLLEQEKYSVTYFGSNMGVNDLGRDLIAKNKTKTYIVQCKYWSKEKEIHENHIMQLYGSVIAYKIENESENPLGIIITNITLSDTAKKFAKMLKIKYIENLPINDFPRIKCNVNYNELTGKTKIYHLPMDAMYDKVVISKPEECCVFTVKEAEDKGFRRALKWHGNT